VKWAIQNTRDGRIPVHAARFTDSGAYGVWLKPGDMDDYNLLDFRTGIPRDQHPSTVSPFRPTFVRISFQQSQICIMPE
jgi:hypothetical protein